MSEERRPSATFRWPVRVYYEDTDAAGVVYHANYLTFMERARTEWLRALGFDQDRLRGEQGVVFAVRRLGVEFLRPARYNDLLTVTAALSTRGRASFDFEQTVVRDDDGVLCCRAEVQVACMGVERMRAARVPEAILSALDARADAPRDAEAIDGL